MLDQYRAAIASHLKATLPPSVTVCELGNSLDEAELQRAWRFWARTVRNLWAAAPM